MPLDLWFPLAIYWADMDEATHHNPSLVEAIDHLFAGTPVAASEQGVRPSTNTSGAASWTGDVHGIDRLHDDPRFGWLTESVAAHAWTYLAELGHDLDEVDLHIQRSWPVVTRPGEFVAAHEHHNAHLSAVYYVEAAPESGSIRFVNTARPNELSPGSGGTPSTYRHPGQLNHGSSEYEPVPGRLLIFPSKHRHQVLANTTDCDRLSISFDLVITTRSDRGGGTHEFLMPPPERWRRLGRPTVNGEIEVRLDRPIDLQLLGQRRDSLDEIALVEPHNHVLWESTTNLDAVSHHMSRLAMAELADTSMSGSNPAESDTSALPGIDPETALWQIWRDGMNRVEGHLVAQGISTLGCQVAGQRVETTGSALVQRSSGDLVVYLRIDRGDTTAAIEFDESHEVQLLDPGSMIVVSGFRRHRVVGNANVLTFELTVPSLARPAGQARDQVVSTAETDLAAFHAVTSLPLAAPMPTSAAIQAKMDRVEGRKRRAERLTACEVSRKFLFDGTDPSECTRAERDVIRGYGTTTDLIFESATDVVQSAPALDAAACSRLVAHAQEHMTSNAPDSVDDRPEYQVNLSVAELHDLVGGDASERLMTLPQQMLQGQYGTDGATPPAINYDRVSLFVRLFTPDTREHLSFHADISGVTVNVPLEEEQIDGGKLLLLYGGALHQAPRERGTALCHDSRVIHGVSRMKNGERWSLIAFFPQLDD